MLEMAQLRDDSLREYDDLETIYLETGQTRPWDEGIHIHLACEGQAQHDIREPGDDVRSCLSGTNRFSWLPAVQCAVLTARSGSLGGGTWGMRERRFWTRGGSP